MRRSWPAPARCGGAGSLWPTPPAGSSGPASSRWPPTSPAAPCSGRRARSPGCSPVPLLLIVVAVLSAVFGQLRDAIAIAAIIAAVAVTETVTEVHAARAIEALRAMTAPTARLHRESWTTEVPAASLVPGDVLAVEAGDIVPADARVLAARGLRADESPLTGEAEPAGKTQQPVPAATGLARRSSLLHAG